MLMILVQSLWRSSSFASEEKEEGGKGPAGLASSTCVNRRLGRCVCMLISDADYMGGSG